MSAASNPSKDHHGVGGIVANIGLAGFGWSANKVKRVESGITDALKAKGKGVAALIAMGKALTEIKGQCEHGQFESIVKLRVGISLSASMKAMQAHRALGNPDTCPDLDKFDTCAVRMLSAKSTPPAVLEQAIRAASCGDHVTVYMVKTLLGDNGESKPKPKATKRADGVVEEARRSVPESKQAQFDRAWSKAEAAYRVWMEQEIARQVEARVAPKVKIERERAEEMFNRNQRELEHFAARNNGIKQAMTKAEWKLVLGILHPDRAPAGQHDKYAEAFKVVMKLKPYIEAFDSSSRDCPHGC